MTPGLPLVLVAFLLCVAGLAEKARAQTQQADQEQEIHTVLAVGPSWESFTNKDGTGLYHEILNKVFGLFSITVQREYMPSVRGRLLVAEGKADLQTCYGYETINGPLMRPRHPMYVGRYHVFFNKRTIPEWNGLESLRNRSVIWRMDYYNKESLTVPVNATEALTGTAALNMVLLGRVDFYMEDATLIHESIRHADITFNPDDYRIEPVGKRRYYPIFNNSPRGRKLMALYEKGMEALIYSGELKSIFKKWGHAYPDFRIN